MREALGLVDATPAGLRRNIIIEGVDLNDWIGEEFELQGLRFAGTQECAPCYWMDRAYAPGAEAFLKGRGGLRAQILTGGTLTAS
jgi:MOSC domain-containing protein YiiM